MQLNDQHNTTKLIAKIFFFSHLLRNCLRYRYTATGLQSSQYSVAFFVFLLIFTFAEHSVISLQILALYMSSINYYFVKKTNSNTNEHVVHWLASMIMKTSVFV